MAINYIEKGKRLHLYIREQGHSLIRRDGVWVSDDDVAVQLLIDNFNELEEAKKEARDRVKVEASKRVAAIYPFVNPDKDEAAGLYDFAVDILVQSNSATGLSGNLLAFKNIRDTAVSKVAEVNALTDWQQVDSYDATVGW